MALIEVDNLQTHFFTREGVVRAVDGVSFAVDKGKTLGVVGESGCGKSVTALSIMRLLPQPPARIVGGAVLLRGHRPREAAGEQPRGCARERDRDDLPGPDDVAESDPEDRNADHGDDAAHLGYDRRRPASARSSCSRRCSIPKAKERLDDYPHRFSGGMRQRVMIAIAISCNPKLLIADEPTTALDVTVQARVLDLLDELQEEHEMAMIVITHDMGVVAEVADDIVVMYAGQIVEQASALDLFDNPEHPYTEALLGALPQIEGAGIREGRLTAIPGRPPDLVNPPPACRFGPRCPYADAATRARRRSPSCARSARATWFARPIRRPSAPRKPTEVSA